MFVELRNGLCFVDVQYRYMYTCIYTSRGSVV